MTSRVIPLAKLPTLLHGASSPIWWGMILFVAIDATVFATLASSYFYLRFRVVEWPPEGLAAPDVGIPAANTAVLLASGLSILWANRGIAGSGRGRLGVGLAAGTLLGVSSLLLTLAYARSLEFDWSSHAYGSIFWMITVYHWIHLLAAILLAAPIAVLVRRGYFTPQRRVGVQLLNIFWQFVVLMWIPVFVILFLIPRWF